MPANVFPRFAVHRVAALPAAEDAPGALLRTPTQLAFSDGAEWHVLATFTPPEPPAAPVNTALPAISGSGHVGDVHTVSNGTWTGNPAPTFAYQWSMDGSPITGATAQTYTPDAEGSLSCAVTATNSEGSATADSPAVTITEATGTTPQISAASVPSGVITNSGRSLTSAVDSTGFNNAIGDTPIAGKQYFELLLELNAANTIGGGVYADFNLFGLATSAPMGQQYQVPAVGVMADQWAMSLRGNNSLPESITDTAFWLSGDGAIPTTHVLCIAVDVAARAGWIKRFGDAEWYGGGDPATGTDPSFLIPGAADIYPLLTTSAAATGSPVTLQLPADHAGATPGGFSNYMG